jgi:hypothetical protein
LCDAQLFKELGRVVKHAHDDSRMCTYDRGVNACDREMHICEEHVAGDSHACLSFRNLCLSSDSDPAPTNGLGPLLPLIRCTVSSLVSSQFTNLYHETNIDYIFGSISFFHLQVNEDQRLDLLPDATGVIRRSNFSRYSPSNLAF